jgi:hypothetical protein
MDVCTVSHGDIQYFNIVVVIHDFQRVSCHAADCHMVCDTSIYLMEPSVFLERSLGRALGKYHVIYIYTYIDIDIHIHIYIETHVHAHAPCGCTIATKNKRGDVHHEISFIPWGCTACR